MWPTAQRLLAAAIPPARASSTAATAASHPRVYVAGIGMEAVTRTPGRSLDDFGGSAVRAALREAGVEGSAVGALYVGNMMAGMLSNQQHVAPLVANAAGLDNAEATTAEVRLEW